MGMPSNRLACCFCFRRDAGQSRKPSIAAVQNTNGRDGQALGRKSESSDVRNADKTFAYVLDLIRLQIVRVTTGDYNVLNLRSGLNIFKDCVPSSLGRLEKSLGDTVGVGTNGIGASAKDAVGRADGSCYFVSVSLLISLGNSFQGH